MKILIAVDHSKDSELAALEVSNRPWPEGTVVKMIHVIDMPFPQVTDVLGVAAESAQQAYGEQTRHAEALLNSLAEIVRKNSGYVAEVITEIIESPFRSSIEQTIVEEAERFDADLIILGSRGHSTWKRLVMGSVSTGVVNHAPCSVEIVRQKAEDGTR